MTPKAVVFDLGKVLVDFDYGIAVRAISAKGTRLVTEIARFLTTSPLLLQYETGLLSNRQFYQEICAATGFNGEFEEFGVCFGDIFTPIEPMVRLHATLHEHDIPTFIFSNTNDLAVTHIRKRFPFFSQFSGYIFSYEHQSMKPDAKLYQVVEQQAGRKGPEILYLDDRLENVEAGGARGWQVILHEAPEKSLHQIAKLWLPVPSDSKL